MDEAKVPEVQEITKPDFLYDGNGCPCFTPTMEQFKDFYSYVRSIEKVGQAAGLVKIIPPAEWIQQQNTSVDLVSSFKIKNPISQTFNCGGLPAGVQRQFNIEHKKVYSVQDWYALSKTEQFQSPVMNYQGKVSLPEKSKKRKKSDYYSESDDDLTQDPRENLHDENGVPAYMRSDPNLETPEYLAAVERFYWRNVSFQNPMYGADLSGSVFTDNEENSWNVSKLENLLSKVGVAVPGVTTPYLYFGMYKSTFAWHVEDMDLFSINYIHFGAPKQWYVVPPAHKSRFEQLARSMFYTEAADCSEFLRHKNCVISPSALASAHIPVQKLVQKANEFVITFPAAYHQGFNIGFNCAESINFATPSWLKFARYAKFCECVNDSVQLDVCSIFGLEPLPVKEKAVKKKKLPSRLPFSIYVAAPPSIKKAKVEPPRLPFPKCHLCPLGHSDDFPLVPTDSPNIVAHVECGAFINETRVETLYVEQEDGEKSDDNKAPKATTIEDDATIHDSTYLIPSLTENHISDSVAESDTGKGENNSSTTILNTSIPDNNLNNTVTLTNAAECANEKIPTNIQQSLAQPPVIATTIARDTVAERIRRKLPNIDKAPYRVLGIDNIPKARWRLKCAWCQYPVHQKGLGACVQCTRGRCVRAFHVTCALLGNIHLKLDDDGVIECFCSAHDPVVKQERKQLAEQNLASVAVERFKVGTPVTCRFAGNNYAGVVVECRVEEKGCLTQFEEQNDPVFAPWISLKVREIPKPKEKKIPVYCTPPRKKKMKQLIDLFLDKDSDIAKNLFPNAEKNAESLENCMPVVQDDAPVILPEIPSEGIVVENSNSSLNPTAPN